VGTSSARWPAPQGSTPTLLPRSPRASAGTARRLHALGALRDGISAADAGAQISLLTSHHAYDELVGDRGWSHDEAAAWAEHALTTQLLREAGPPR
jgi:hypothetical protein